MLVHLYAFVIPLFALWGEEMWVERNVSYNLIPEVLLFYHYFLKYQTGCCRFLDFWSLRPFGAAGCSKLVNDMWDDYNISCCWYSIFALISSQGWIQRFQYILYAGRSGTKGGSSGSPVVDCQGRAVALNAGSKSSSASAFFLPLERVVRALNLIRDSWDGFGTKPESVYIPRGTLQATFQHKGFEETRRLGLRNETEQMVRVVSPAGETGMLVVDSVVISGSKHVFIMPLIVLHTVLCHSIPCDFWNWKAVSMQVPEGPAHKHLEPGDVLIRINEEVSTAFNC